jgi:uncharacterized membrane protein (DUF373 family)
MTVKMGPYQLKFPEIHFLFRTSLRYILNVLMVFIILVLGIGLAKTIYGLKEVLVDISIGHAFHKVVTDILSFLVVIELFRSFIDFFEAHRFRLHAVIDPAMVFLVREIIVMLYDTSVRWRELFGLGFIVLALGIVRTLAVRYSPGQYPDVEEG